MEDNERKRVGFHLAKNVRVKIKQIALDNEKSSSEIVTRAINIYYALLKKEKLLTKNWQDWLIRSLKSYLDAMGETSDESK